ncbi:hypothetical protein FHW69_002158 [Luteibacter sp. Sphag1AF]|uniref:hypothetical protein n=1 Tax=Luteibacter sp. Sphag1AF TaxID=2587031 RepID=UPI00160808E3|nr:hypothetical protein [Luteibacter sp. Sphag1AF]MBB3227535.1 hypothetical protein [Luteibacter sp. Sphag1AF]
MIPSYSFLGPKKPHRKETESDSPAAKPDKAGKSPSYADVAREVKRGNAMAAAKKIGKSPISKISPHNIEEGQKSALPVKKRALLARLRETWGGELTQHHVRETAARKARLEACRLAHPEGHRKLDIRC